MFARLALLALVACRDASPPPASPPAKPAPVAAESKGLPGWPVPTGWRSEVIPFPLGFAPSLAHRGYEDLRFAPGMFDPAAPGYWSYTFVWRTEDAAQLDAKALGDELTLYFRGLIAAVDEQKRITARDDIVVTASGNGPRFRLRAVVFDAFKTAQRLELDGWAERRSCGSGALWIFVLARDGSPIRGELDTLADGARC